MSYKPSKTEVTSLLLRLAISPQMLADRCCGKLGESPVLFHNSLTVLRIIATSAFFE
jgi:hypothetical protein